MQTQIHLGSQRKFTVSGLDSKGNPAPLDLNQPLRFQNAVNCNVLAVTGDNASVVIVPTDQNIGGTFSVDLLGDSDLTPEGVVDVFGHLDGTVIPEVATTIGIAEGEETPIGTPT